MVPMDVPEVAFDMMNRFVNNQAFIAGSSKISQRLIDTTIQCDNSSPDIQLVGKSRKQIRTRRVEPR